MDAVIMTGGKGMRMAPYTKVLPKGLLPVGDLPILEIIVKQLKHFGFRSITMSCGYLAPLIKTYFGDGSAWGVSIRYYVEQAPLGTVGALTELQHLKQPFLLMNCDVLTSFDFREFWKYHCAGDSLLTVASQKKNIPIDLGVLQTSGDQVVDLIEKPNRTALVSMGIYMMNPEVIRYIPRNQFFDTPDLIRALIKEQKKVRHMESDAFWLDIGKPSDYAQANEEFAENRQWLLPGEGS